MAECVNKGEAMRELASHSCEWWPSAVVRGLRDGLLIHKTSGLADQFCCCCCRPSKSVREIGCSSYVRALSITCQVHSGCIWLRQRESLRRRQQADRGGEGQGLLLLAGHRELNCTTRCCCCDAGLQGLRIPRQAGEQCHLLLLCFWGHPPLS